MNLPKITIVTPSFNQGLYLESCIESVVNQNYPNLEYIVMDGGSSDLTSLIIEKYKEKISFTRSCKDGGQYSAIQEGFEMATGEILGWLNSDDMLHPGSLWIIANTYLNNPNVDWFTGIPVAWNKFGEIVYINSYPPDWGYDYFMNLLDSNSPFLQQESTFFTKKLWVKAGAKFDDAYNLAADFELWLRFSRYSNVCKINALIGGFRLHDDQKTNIQRDMYMSQVKSVIDHELFNTKQKVEVRKLYHINEIVSHIATSIAPKDLLNQVDAVETWINNGFTVHSFNCKNEIEFLQIHFPNVKFHEVNKTAIKESGKPLVYLVDIFTYFNNRNLPFTLVNSDIHMSVKRGLACRFAYELRAETPKVLVSSRVEIENEFQQFSNIDLNNSVTNLKYGRNYFMGFDLFAFNSSAVNLVCVELSNENKNSYALGVPWWDYFLPLLFIKHGVDSDYLLPSPIYHKYHEAQYSKDLWMNYGVKLCKNFELLSDDDLSKLEQDSTYCDIYLNKICSQICRFVTNGLKLKDLGQIVRFVENIETTGLMNDFLTWDKFNYMFYNEILMVKDKLRANESKVSNLHALLTNKN